MACEYQQLLFGSLNDKASSTQKLLRKLFLRSLACEDQTISSKAMSLLRDHYSNLVYRLLCMFGELDWTPIAT
eukprot:UN05821